jgi:membrane fusion protein (multidrug efflux system)
LLADADPEAQHWLRAIAAGYFDLEVVSTGHAALDVIAAGNARLVIVGARLDDMTGTALLARSAQWLDAERRPPMTFLLAGIEGDIPEADEKYVRVFYRLVRTMQPDRVRGLFTQAAAQLPPTPPREPDPALVASVSAIAARLGQLTDPVEIAGATIAAITELVAADRARCLYCDEETGVLWSGLDSDEEGSASSGLAGFAMRAVAGLILPHAKDDPQYIPAVDDPVGTGRERIAVQPIAAPDGHVHAVVIAIRENTRPPFQASDLDKLEAFAAAWAPYVMQLSMQVETDAILGDQLDQGPSDIFRQQAIMHLMRRGARGDVVRVHPGWVRSAYWIVLATLIGGGVFATFAHVSQYAQGPAVVRFTGRNEIVAYEPGTIASLDVARGQTVAAGQVLARLHDTEQIGHLHALETEFERKLVAYLQTPADPGVRQELSQIVSQRESARATVESRVIRAPRAGVIKEVLVRNGQHVDPGKVVLSIVEKDTAEGLSVLAFVPGTERPRLRAHQQLRLTLPGFRGAELTTEVRAVSSEVLGAAEARARYLGDRLGDSLPLSGTVVVVEAQLTTPEFKSDGQKFQLHDGMIGVAEIKLESRSILESIIPGLR